MLYRSRHRCRYIGDSVVWLPHGEWNRSGFECVVKSVYSGEMMAKYNVGTIEEQAKRTLDTYRGRPGKAFVNNLKIYQMRVYIEKVLFLCKEIKKLKKKK